MARSAPRIILGTLPYLDRSDQNVGVTLAIVSYSRDEDVTLKTESPSNVSTHLSPPNERTRQESIRSCDEAERFRPNCYPFPRSLRLPTVTVLPF